MTGMSTRHAGAWEPDARTARLLALVLAVTICTIYLYGIRGFPLAEPDEGRYAEIPREMLLSGDWITPHLNFVKYFEKPPLVYWASAISFTLFGTSELAARLPSYFSALGTIALTAALAYRMYGPATGLLSATMLATCPFFAAMGIVLTLDMSLTFCLTLSFTAAWFAAQHSSRRLFQVAWLGAALGVMTKGPVALVLICAGLTPFLYFHGGLRQVRRALDPRGLAIAAAVAVPWFVAVSWRNPDFVEFFVVDQHIGRFLWRAEHGQPIWFFLPLLPAMMLPWSLAPVLEWRRWRDEWTPRSWSPATRFLLLWALAIIGFFSLSTSKLPTYVLPALPPLAILLARGMIKSGALERPTFFSGCGWGLMVLGVVGVICGVVLPSLIAHPSVAFLQPYMLVGGVGLTVFATVLRANLAKPKRRLAILTATILAFLLLTMSGRDAASSYTTLGLTAARLMAPGDRLAAYRHYVQGIPFYSGHRMIMITSWGELDFGSKQGDQSEHFWPDVEQLREAWREDRRLFLVINRKELVALDPPLGETVIELASEGKKMLVVNHQPVVTRP